MLIETMNYLGRCLIALLLFASTSRAETDLASMVRELRLANGMKWIIVERPQAPIFTGYIRVRAGGADEEPGYTGLAHLFEHMAFKGTPVLGTKDFGKEKELLGQIAEVGDALSVLERQGKGTTPEASALQTKLDGLSKAHSEISDENALTRLYQLNGATGLNATTDKDLTSYFVSFPKNRLELWATVEASRLASPVLRDFYKERDVVMEERRMRVESDPNGALFEELNQVAFTMSPYRWPVVGYVEDLKSMTLQRAQAFHQRYYVPSNAIGCIVGDVKFKDVVPLLERTFGSIPAAAAPLPPLFAEPPSHQFRRSTLYFDASPRFFIGFRKPSLPAKDDYVFDMIQIILGQGRTSRLHRRLVQKDRLAQFAGTFGEPGSRLDNLFVIGVVPLAEKKSSAAEDAVWSELQRLKNEKVTKTELEKTRNRIMAEYGRVLESNAGMAETLSYFEAIAGSWRYLVGHTHEIESITAEDIQRVAQKYFNKENATLVDLQPKTTVSLKGGGR